MSEEDIDRDFYLLKGHTSDVTWCDFNSNHLLASSSNDKTVRIWKLNEFGVYQEATNGKLKSPLNVHTYGVNCVRFSPFGTILATASTDGHVILWNVQTGEQVVCLESPSQCAVRVCCFSPTSAILITAGDDEKICLWDISTRSLIRVLDAHDAMVTACSFTPDSSYFISSSTAGDIKLWDARLGHGKCLITVMDAHDLGVLCCEFNPRYEVNANNGPLQSYYLLASCGNDDLVKLWHVKGGLRGSIDLSATLSGHNGNVNQCRFSKDGLLLASAAGDKTVIIWSVSTGIMLARLEGHSRYVTCCSFSNDGDLLATGSNDKTIIIWNIGKCLKDANFVRIGVSNDELTNGITAVNHREIVGSVSGANLVSQWSVEHVAEWLRSIALEKYCDIFIENQIDGTELLHMSHDTLLTVIKINALGHRNKILRAIQALRNPLWQHLALSEEENAAMPDELFCPITHELMHEPVVANDGYTYEKQAILEWLANGNSTSPMTNDVLKSKQIVPNLTLKLLIKRYLV